MTHRVSGTPYFEERAKAVLRKMVWQVAAFSGVEVLTDCIMRKHLGRFCGPVASEHVLLRCYHIGCGNTAL